MIIPYDHKPTQVDAGHGVAEIDFNAIWNRAYFSVLNPLGYEPVLADQDSAPLIINHLVLHLIRAACASHDKAG
jgi:hypothetical protein